MFLKEIENLFIYKCGCVGFLPCLQDMTTPQLDTLIDNDLLVLGTVVYLNKFSRSNARLEYPGKIQAQDQSEVIRNRQNVVVLLC